MVLHVVDEVRRAVVVDHQAVEDREADSVVDSVAAEAAVASAEEVEEVRLEAGVGDTRTL